MDVTICLLTSASAGTRLAHMSTHTIITKRTTKHAAIRDAITQALVHARTHNLTKDADVAIEVVVRLAEHGFGIVRRMPRVGPTVTGRGRALQS